MRFCIGNNLSPDSALVSSCYKISYLVGQLRGLSNVYEFFRKAIS